MFCMDDATTPTQTTTTNKYKVMLEEMRAREECLNGTNRERLDWLLRRQARQVKDCEAGQSRGPWHPPTIYPDKIAEILGIETSRVNDVCDRAKLTPHMNDARCELQVRQLRQKWDDGEACDVVDLTEAALMFRCSAQKARMVLSDHGVRPTNAGRKPYLYPRADVLALIENGVLVNPRQPRQQVNTSAVSELRADKYRREQEIYAEYADRIASQTADLKRERDAAIAACRAEYDARIREAGG